MFILLVTYKSIFKFGLHGDFFILTALAELHLSHLFPFISYSGKIAFIVNGRCKCSDFMQIVHALEYHKWFNFFTFVNHVSNKSKAKMLFLRYLQWLHWITLLSSVFPSNIIVLIQDLWTYSGIMKERKITIIMFSDLLCIYPYTNSVASTFPFLMPAKYSSCT